MEIPYPWGEMNPAQRDSPTMSPVGRDSLFWDYCICAEGVRTGPEWYIRTQMVVGTSKMARYWLLGPTIQNHVDIRFGPKMAKFSNVFNGRHTLGLGISSLPCIDRPFFLSRFAKFGGQVDLPCFGNNFVGVSSKMNTDSCIDIPDNVVRMSRTLLWNWAVCYLSPLWTLWTPS